MTALTGVNWRRMAARSRDQVVMFGATVLHQRAAVSFRKVAAKRAWVAMGMDNREQYCSTWKIQVSRDSPFFPEKGAGRSGLMFGGSRGCRVSGVESWSRAACMVASLSWR